MEHHGGTSRVLHTVHGCTVMCFVCLSFSYRALKWHSRWAASELLGQILEVEHNRSDVVAIVSLDCEDAERASQVRLGVNERCQAR
jgi:hypothetical protein